MNNGSFQPITGGSTSTTILTKSTTAAIALNNVANYFDGPSVAQGTSGIWFVSGSVTVLDTAGAANFDAKLWDGTTVIDSGYCTSGGASFGLIISLSGVISNPAGNLRISVKDFSSTSGSMTSTFSGNSNDSTITAIRIG